MQDSTTFREDFLLLAVELAEENGAGHFCPVEQVITRGKLDPFKARDALAFWCGFHREGATEPVLVAYGKNPRPGSFAINHESLRMVDEIRRARRTDMPPIHIEQVDGAVHTGSGNLNIHVTSTPAAESKVTEFWAAEIRRLIQAHIETWFDQGDAETMAIGPLMEIITDARKYRGNVVTVRMDKNSGRFVPDPHSCDGVRVQTGNGESEHVPITAVKGVRNIL